MSIHFRMFSLWELFWLLTAETKPKLLFYFHSHLSEHSIWSMFPYFRLRTVLSHLSKSLPNGRAVSYTTEQDIPPHARVSGAERPLTVSHSETPSHALHCGFIQTTISPLKARFQTCHSCFPWHTATEAVLVSLCVCTNTTSTTTLLQCSLHFPKTNPASGPSKTVMPLRGESLNVHAWEACERVLSVVNNKQNRYIPAAYKQGRPRRFSEALLWRLQLSGSSWRPPCTLFRALGGLSSDPGLLWDSEKDDGETNWSVMAGGLVVLPLVCVGSVKALPQWFNLSQTPSCLLFQQ